ncbi:uncharacterized protein OCT59_001530 [Rhizophagus irregularis]|uniref:Uncharacterized protein n=2 Tax=Rhizophagus irregularis TaxID=588596 RepID=U9URI4_RHIID|nr:hypothetical protein GLOIN_2v184682 [Rhizophagus irregularis DAOM 181602=DAOM 197198]EXX53042.1 hypothetical protein RirG_247660 [Rhizophagus irregularis DAOM 197198w]POG69292.1 hypothetical protein GLOIN_2v184682 [Rhizophagus irregularis DAOM 181602=DAOM 197198]UZO00278.1 hypothetical protein OCT59_001530 [Rhizophagus irregularis]GBC50495.1 hypothetical protein GLOIN_2v184682 [Rhizophagus irregularis DAOM 181602=DAOM 197198]|eukprot:XP_025176158.1 hypothetical protein GLOIN_2v184682 [Rhizophagus irregularis DAOM 181602=DAOM 197198]
MSENLDEIVNGNNSFLMSNNKIPIIINNPTGAPYDFHKEVVPQFLNYLRNYPQKPGIVYNPVDIEAIKKMNPGRKLHYIGNFSQDPSLADFFKHLRETATEMQKNGDEAVQPLIPEKVPSKMIKLNERTSKKIHEFIKNESFTELNEFVNSINIFEEEEKEVGKSRL